MCTEQKKLTLVVIVIMHFVKLKGGDKTAEKEKEKEKQEKKEKSKSAPSLPPIVYAEVSVQSVGGVSLFETRELVTSRTVADFFSEHQLVKSAVSQLRKEGFEVLQVGPTTITIGARAEVYERVFKTKIVPEERDVIKEFNREDTATFLDCPDTAVPGLIDPSKSSLADILEGVALNEPVYYFASPIPPSVGYWHLDVPDDVGRALNVKGRATGRNVKVVMVDTGWYRHPFFDHHGFRANPVVLGPGASDPDHDEHGHGTGESANVFAAAPDVDFTMVKMSFVNTVGAFNTAVSLRPDIISCSWGYDIRTGPLSASMRTLAAAVANAVHKGIIVIFSAGNGHWAFPGQHPDVISAGGVFMGADGSLQATPYASGFESAIYPGRKVPDVCGLVGLPPKALYIMLPIEPECTIDRDLSDGTHPNGDETAPDDGWAAFSGTSAAAPQLAGVCALMKQVWPQLTPAKARDILKRTARDITKGNCSARTGGHPAVPGPDLATGHGLVDASQAKLLTLFVRMLSALPRYTSKLAEEVTKEEMQALEDMLLASVD